MNRRLSSESSSDWRISVGSGRFRGRALVQLLGVALVHNHRGVARELVGEYWAAGLVRLQSQVQVGRGGHDSSSTILRAESAGWVPGHLG